MKSKPNMEPINIEQIKSKLNINATIIRRKKVGQNEMT